LIIGSGEDPRGRPGSLTTDESLAFDLKAKGIDLGQDRLTMVAMAAELTSPR
jgi:hypothetical protein